MHSKNISGLASSNFFDTLASEFANVIIISKASKMMETGDAAKLKEIEALVRKLNPKAKIIVPLKDKYGDLDVETLIDTGLFNMEESQSSLGWAEELLKGEHAPETEEYGISSLAFIAKDMPFHPTRLAMILRGFGDYGSVSKTKDKEEKGESKETEKRSTTQDSNKDVFKGVVRTKGHIWWVYAVPSFHSPIWLVLLTFIAFSQQVGKCECLSCAFPISGYSDRHASS